MLPSFVMTTLVVLQSINNMIHLVVFPVVSLRDTETTTSKQTTVEYNVQTNAIVGLTLYSIAFWFLLQVSADSKTNEITEWLASNCHWNKQFVALSIAASYEYNAYIFSSVYCQPYERKTFVQLIQDGSFPIYLLFLLLLTFAPVAGTANENNITIAASFFFACRMLMLGLDYHNTSAAKTATQPQETSITFNVRPASESNDKHDPAETKTPTPANVWKVYGHEYDVTDFVKHHPGGVESIMLAANRHDCTALFQSYHAFNIRKAKAVLEKYRISPSTTPDDDKKLQASYPIGHHNDLFYEELVQSVSKKLRDNGVDPVKDRYASWSRYLLYFTNIVAILVAARYHLQGNLFGSFCLGVLGVYLGGIVGHDGGHYAISSLPWVNDLCLMCMSFICNPIVWQHQHTYAHHSYTNEHDHDPDLHHFFALMRYSPVHKYLPHYSMQMHKAYVLFAFMFTSNGTTYANTWRFIFERSLHGTVEWTNRTRWTRTAIMLIHLIAYPTLNYIIPYFYHKSIIRTIVCGMTQSITSGFLFALFSQVGHITESNLIRDPATVDKRRADIAKKSWAAEQVETTNDYCPDSQLMILLEGQLNVQIEHHLFPSLNHRHLIMIQPTVEEVSLKHGVDYKKYVCWSDVMSATLDHLYKLGTDNSNDCSVMKHQDVSSVSTSAK